MAKEKPLRSPKGTLVFPALIRPDTKFDSNGQYKADLALTPDTNPKHAEFINQLRTWYKAHTGKVHPKNPASDNKNALYYIETDKDTDEPTGRVVVKFRVKNKISKKTGELWDRQPALADSRGNLIEGRKPKIGGGTVGYVSFEKYAGVVPGGGDRYISLQPVLFQIIELVTYEGRARTAADYGVEAEEDGWVADEEEDEDDATKTSKKSRRSADDDDDEDTVSSTDGDDDDGDY